MVIQIPDGEIFVPEEQLAWVRVDDDLNVRVVFVSGREGTLNAHAFNDRALVDKVLEPIRNDTARFIRLRGGKQYVNLRNVLRVVLDEANKAARITFPTVEQIEYSGEDWDTISQWVRQLEPVPQ